MKNILVLVHDDPGQEARLQCALDIVRATNGHLNCLDVASPPLLADSYAGNYGQALVVEQALDTEKANRMLVEPRLVAEGVPYTWEETIGVISERIVDRSALNDLVVVSLAGHGSEAVGEHVAQHIASRAGRPIMAVPNGLRSIDVFGPAMIAWDGSDAAESAMRAALPLLGFASKVELVTIGDRGGLRTSEEAAAYCDRHGIELEVVNLPKGEARTYEALLERAKASGAKWMVMGAYGHSHLRENLLGGTTRDMLRHSPIPLFLAH